MSKSCRMTIFRRFGKLIMVNLLDLQAELADLEERYQLVYGADNKSNDPARTCLSKKFSALRDSEKSGVKVKPAAEEDAVDYSEKAGCVSCVSLSFLSSCSVGFLYSS